MQLVHDHRYREMLRHDDDPGAAVRFDELGEVARHRLGVVRHENPLLTRRKLQDLEVAEALQVRKLSRSEVHTRRSANQRGDDNLVEVGVRLKADHGQDAMAVRRAAASFW